MPQMYTVSADGTIVSNELWKAADWKRVQSAARKSKVRMLGMVNNYADPDGFEPSE